MTGYQNFYKELGYRIKKARDEKRLTQESLAAKISLNRTSVTNIESGRQQVLVHTLVDIANALQVSVESLLPQPQLSSANKLEDLLKDHSPAEKEWIKASIQAKFGE